MRSLLIATKCASASHGYESTLKGVQQSLASMRLGEFAQLNSFPYHIINYINRLDYVDLFLVHDPMSGKERRLATYKALLEAKASGKIRTVGVSN